MDKQYEEELPVPWSREPALTRELLVDGSVNGKSRFFQLDVWHTIHLGVGKSWIGCGVIMLSKLIPESNMDERIATIGREYLAFCRAARMDPIIRKIDVHTFGTTTDPIATWNKAATTRNFMLFLEDFCNRRADLVERDDRMRVFVSSHLCIYLFIGSTSFCLVYVCK